MLQASLSFLALNSSTLYLLSVDFLTVVSLRYLLLYSFFSIRKIFALFSSPGYLKYLFLRTANLSAVIFFDSNPRRCRECFVCVNNTR